MKTYEYRARLSALASVQTPRHVSRIARVFAWIFVIGPLLTLWIPWQQNIMGTGYVSAYAPLERRQLVESPVGGRIKRWFVQEGAKVKAGDLLVELSDVDQSYAARLAEQRAAAANKLAAKDQELRSYRLQIANLEATRDLQITTARQRLDVSRQRVQAASEAVESARATLYAAKAQRERFRRLLNDGLVSQRDYEVAERDETVALRGLNSAEANLKSADAELRAAEVDLQRIATEAQSRIDSAKASANKTESELQDARVSLVKSDVDVSRQQSQTVYAPRDGAVFRISANTEGMLIQQGEALLTLIPDTEARAVELWVDGNDAPLITPGRHARLQFEGWPAVQFVAWPEVAIGTFGGTVAYVDATDDGKGKFRVMILPDEGQATWPSGRFLRQGVRTKGWVLLNRVSLAYEIWRQLNGFPPVFPDDVRQPDLARKTLK
ncbi:HlyD family secretion protein [Methylotetracoccus oryzae]|uniref:HlyD family secretion protein n=1 Tax=Methylotetracoccus oryzae TaxID=1919059 RepID=UPI00111BA92F|nr:HlyD family efflux transporter periplasmic adaptor subunit [Methylotetracoccus oryzae]